MLNTDLMIFSATLQARGINLSQWSHQLRNIYIRTDYIELPKNKKRIRSMILQISDENCEAG
jgi:hypothetical protein